MRDPVSSSTASRMTILGTTGSSSSNLGSSPAAALAIEVTTKLPDLAETSSKRGEHEVEDPDVEGGEDADGLGLGSRVSESPEECEHPVARLRMTIVAVKSDERLISNTPPLDVDSTRDQQAYDFAKAAKLPLGADRSHRWVPDSGVCHVKTEPLALVTKPLDVVHVCFIR